MGRRLIIGASYCVTKSGRRAAQRYIDLGILPDFKSYCELSTTERKQLCSRAWKSMHPGLNQKLTQMWRDRNREQIKEYNRVQGHQNRLGFYNRMRERVFDVLGRKCACTGCDIQDTEFLCIDHILPVKYVRYRSREKKVYAEVLSHPDPKSAFRIFCYNCNMATRFFRACPHNRHEVEQFHLVCDRIALKGLEEAFR